MERFFYGQHIIDHKERKFQLTELFWSIGVFDETRPYHSIEFEGGYKTHIQGPFEECQLSKIGFVGSDLQLQVLTIEQARYYITKQFLKFE